MQYWKAFYPKKPLDGKPDILSTSRYFNIRFSIFCGVRVLEVEMLTPDFAMAKSFCNNIQHRYKCSKINTKKLDHYSEI